MEEKLHHKRQDELQTSQEFRVTNCFALASAYAPQVLAPLITFGAYSITKTVSDQPNFSEATAVTSFSILNLVSTPAMQLLLAIPMGAQAIGCYGRIQTFLQTPEYTPPSTATTSNTDVASLTASQGNNVEPGSNVALECSKQPHEKVEAHCELKGFPPIRFTPNSFIIITGPSGCGKSTVLRDLLAFEESQESSLFPSGDIAYCPQTPWIFEGTIRDNIVGQSAVDDAWYLSVIRSCELHVDLDRMPKGDGTEVDSGGSKLSGGQKQRIGIARALYSKKKRVVFDDVTSALDGHTMSSLVTNIFGETGIIRSQGMSAVVATHAVQILRSADQVFLMDQDGQVIDSGSYQELAERQQYFSEHQKTNPTAPASPKDIASQSQELEASRGEYEARLQAKVDDLRRKKGDWNSFIYYLGAMGWLGLFLFVTGTVLYVVLNAIFGVWLVWWAGDTDGSRGLGYWLGLYATWAVLITLGVLITPIFFFTKLASKASHVMHAELLTATMRAPRSALSNTEDTGSLVNRFSQDIRLCDWQLPFNILLTLMVAASRVSFNVPVSLFLDSIQGITTIHSFGWSSTYVQKSYSLLDSSQKPYYLLFCVQRWLILVLALIATGMELVVIGIAIALRTRVSAGLVGLAVVHVTTLARSLSDLVMQWTEMETSLGAVSRIYRFTRETPRERGSDERPTALPEGWPLAGSITFENVSATYEEVEENPKPNVQPVHSTSTSLGSAPYLALNNITFTINAGERVGICGRTGSGKSSLIAALLQILPCYQGRIFIDATDLSTLDPEAVRSKLNYVTQEPFLFGGTMRENLIPWDDQVTDEEMTLALEKVNLLKKLESLGGLGALLSRDSFSHGEKQLFCLARSLLRSSRILILDEPTGHIDPTMDATIQQIIKVGFSGRTIIMIAHRLRTLMEFDTVVVMDSGRVCEIGQPKALLDNSTSAFNALYHAI
ncbi:hypothetical protein F66182_7765 [Fusarium sp. NRRL 66182]|nr:hypothetical protein F66182_7765 [Fusarium sp. NRRL 66182]